MWIFLSSTLSKVYTHSVPLISAALSKLINLQFFLELLQGTNIPITFGKNVQANASLMIPSATHTLNASNTVLTLYFASIGIEFVINSDTKAIFLATDP